MDNLVLILDGIERGCSLASFLLLMICVIPTLNQLHRAARLSAQAAQEGLKLAEHIAEDYWGEQKPEPVGDNGEPVPPPLDPDAGYTPWGEAVPLEKPAPE